MCPVPCGCGAHSAYGLLLAALALTRSTDMIGWGLRFVNILSAGIYALYYYNARSSISLNRLFGWSGDSVGDPHCAGLWRRSLPRVPSAYPDELHHAFWFHAEPAGA